MKTLQKTIEWLFYIFIFLLPWQTRWIYKVVNYKNEFSEYQSQSLYGTEILLIVLFALTIIFYIKKISSKQIFQKLNQKKFFYFAALIAIIAALIILNIVFSANAGTSFYKVLTLIEGFALAIFIIFYPYNFKKFSWAFIGAGLIQSIYAINQFFNQKIIANKWLGMAAQDPEILGTSVIETASGRFLRAYGALPHPNILAGFLVICLLFIVYQYLTETNKKKINIILTSFIITFTALFMTFSRSAWLAMFVSMIFIIIMAGIKKDLWKKYKLPINKIIITILFIAIAFSLVKSDLIFTRIQIEDRLEIKSMTERLTGYKDAWQIFKNNIFLGTGLGNYTIALAELRPDWEVWDLQPVHNGLFLSIIEMGIILSIMLLGFIILICRYLIKLLKGKWFNMDIIFSISIILSLFIICLLDHFLWSFYFGIMLLAFSALILRFTLRPPSSPRGN